MRYVIFGGTNDIVYSLVKRLPSTSDIYLLGRSSIKYQTVFGDNPNVRFEPLDLSSIEQFNEFVASNKKLFDQSIIIYSASVSHVEFFDDVDSELIVNSVNVNFLVPYLLLNFLCNQSCLPKKFIYLSSISAMVPRVRNILYSSQKYSFDSIIFSLKGAVPFAIVSIRLGFVLTEYARPYIRYPFLAVNADSAAKDILGIIERRNSGVYIRPLAWIILRVPFIRWIVG